MAALRRAGFEAEGASSVGQALAAIRARDFALLCLDVHLGGDDGLDLLEFVRERRPKLPVIVMTGQDSLRNRNRAEALDAQAFLAKPFALSRLRELVRCFVDEATGGEERQAGAPRPLSVMTYSHDSIGLGHTRRNTNIAAGLERRVDGVSVLMMVGCPSGVVFDLPAGVDFIKLPSVVKVGRDAFEPGKLRIPREATRELRVNLLLRAAELFRPDLLLVDHVPAGVWSELLPTLDALRASASRPRLALGLRDILDEPEKVRARWRDEGIGEVVSRYYDDVLVYGSRDVYDTVSEYGLDDWAPGRTRYCGYVACEDDLGVTPALRRELGCEGRQLMVVTAGGGYDAYPMMSRTMDALEAMPSRRRPHTVFIAGPLMDDELRSELTRRARGLDAQVMKSVPGALPYVNSADLVVTMGAYNTLVDVARLGKPCIVVPRMGPSAEQLTRARRFEAMGYVRTLLPEQATPKAMAGLIGSALGGRWELPAPLTADGVDNAVNALERALGVAGTPAPSLRAAV